MTATNPIRIPGRWREGFALDFHTVSSTYLGDDEYGHPIFDTRRTELGELLYRLKNKGDRSVVEEIAEATAGFLTAWNPGAELLLPVPPSRSGRAVQPVHLLAEALERRIGLPVRRDGVRCIREVPELKNVYEYEERERLLRGAHSVEQAVVEGRRVLLFDDLFRSGATMNAITNELYGSGHAAHVFVLAVTRTRRNR